MFSRIKFSTLGGPLFVCVCITLSLSRLPQFNCPFCVIVVINIVNNNSTQYLRCDRNIYLCNSIKLLSLKVGTVLISREFILGWKPNNNSNGDDNDSKNDDNTEKSSSTVQFIVVHVLCVFVLFFCLHNFSFSIDNPNLKCLCLLYLEIAPFVLISYHKKISNDFWLWSYLSSLTAYFRLVNQKKFQIIEVVFLRLFCSPLTFSVCLYYSLDSAKQGLMLSFCVSLWKLLQLTSMNRNRFACFLTKSEII